MKITFLNGKTPAELKENYPNSMFLEDQFDTSIIGINELSKSIIYNMYGVIDLMIEQEYPEVDPEEDQWNECYDEMNERLCYGDGMYGLESLQDFINDKVEFDNTELPPYTICDHDDVINYLGKEKFLEIEIEE
jgi:hypothetical protein